MLLPGLTSIIWTPGPHRLVAGLLMLCAGLAGCQTIPPAARLAQPDAAPTVRGLGAPLEHEDSPGPQLIDLDTALRLAGVENPTIALADEIVRARLAERLLARTLLFPTIEVGGNYRDHRGVFQAGNGTIIHTDEQSLFYGLGADVKGGGTALAPGVRLTVHLADAYFAPQAAQQRVIQGRFDAVSIRHATLLDVGVRYLALVDAQARYTAYQQSLKDVEEIAQLTAAQLQAGKGKESDAERARAEFLLLQALAERAQEEIGVAGAELARLLTLDPSAALRPADRVPPLLDLIDPGATLSELLETALASHPEIVARNAEVRYQEIRLRQEKVRPWLPLLVVGISVGEFGGGASTTMPTYGNFSTRTEIYVAGIWSLQNLGLGNQAVQNVARSGRDQARLLRAQLFDRIGREVAEAYSLIQARREQIDLARARVESSQRGFRSEVTRAKNLLALPIEVLTTTRQLTDARQDLIGAMIAYSQAQLQLRVALGGPPAR